MCPPSWPPSTSFPPHPSGFSQSASFECPASCIELESVVPLPLVAHGFSWEIYCCFHAFLSGTLFLSETVRYSWRTGWVYMLNFCLSLQMPSWQKWSTASLCFLFSRVQCKCVPFALLTTSHQSGIAVGGVRLPPRSGYARSPLSPGLAPMLCAGWWRGRPALSALLTEQGMEEECLSWSLNLQKGLGFSSVGLEWGVCA